MTRTSAPLAWEGDARTLNDLVEECFQCANASAALDGMSDLVSRAREYGFSKATWNHVFMKVASTAFQDQADIVNMQADPKDRLKTILTSWDFSREADKLRTRICCVNRRLGDPISKPLNEHYVLHRHLPQHG